MANFVPRFQAWVDQFAHRLQPSSLDILSLLGANTENGSSGTNGRADLLEAGSASLYATALEAAEDGVILARRAGESEHRNPLRIAYVNEAFERITGFGSSDLEDRGLDVLVGDHTDLSALRRFYQSVRNRERSKMELAIDRRDGSRCWIEMTAAPVTDGMPYVVMIVRDVTERKERERHERVEREVLEDISEGGSVEEGLDRLLGLLEETESARAAILLMEERTGTLRHLAAPSLPDPFVQQIEAIDGPTTVATCGTAYLQNEGVVVTDVEEDERWKAHRHVAARWGIEACWANPIRSSDGQVMGVLAVYHTDPRAPSPDEWNAVRKVAHLASIIVEWKRAEVALEESEHLFRTLAEESHLGIYLIQDGELQYVNPRFCEITGYPYRELVTRRSLEEVVHPEDWAGFRDDIRRCAEGEEGEDVHREYRIETSEGEERHVELFGTSVAYLGKSAVFGTVVDVTERKDEQQALINAKEEAEEMHQLKSAFLANMSHEIRTPLTSILGFSEILADEVPEEGEEFVGLIQQSGERLYQTLNSVLDLSELEAGAIHVSDEPIDVADRLATTVDLLLPQAVQKDVDLNVETPYGGVEARVDGASFDRIVTNLVHNAIKFTEEGRVTVRLEEGDERFRVYVEDTGVGVSEDFLPELFEAFRQESSGLTRSHEGAGLGLTITHRLVQILGGTIDVESTKGQGTTFTVELPKEPSDE